MGKIKIYRWLLGVGTRRHPRRGVTCKSPVGQTRAPSKSKTSQTCSFLIVEILPSVLSLKLETRGSRSYPDKSATKRGRLSIPIDAPPDV
jgi:hypothetical protein